MPSQNRRRLLRYAIIAIVGSGMFVVGIVAWRPTQISWHRWRMDAARRAHYSQPAGPSGGLDVGRDWANFEKHRDALVSLGVFAELRYKFRYIMSSTDESNHFVRALIDAPPSIYWEAPSYGSAQSLAVWCRTEDASTWDEWVEARDVPDYRERFMEESG